MAEGDTKSFNVEATETIKRVYRVTAKDDKDARKRLHLHWKDPEMLREGIVSGPHSEAVSNQQVTDVTEVKAPSNPSPKPGTRGNGD